MNEKEIELVDIVLKKGKDIYMQTEKTSRHTVVAGVLADSGNIYLGINCDSIHGTCAEIVAYVNAVLANEKKLKTIVAASVRGEGYDRIVAPCGNCRQILVENVPLIDVIINEAGTLRKYKISELLPHIYVKNDD